MRAGPDARRPLFYAFLLIAAALAAGCSIFHWPGYAPQGRPNPGGGASTAAAPSPPLTKQELNASYYYDLGPDTIDVSNYPQKQQANYKVFVRACSQCHTLARAVNSPRSSPVAWKYYIFRLRLQSKFAPGKGFNRREATVALDFLNYDSKMRKGKHRDDFEALSRTLERHFDRVLYRRMRILQEQNPPLGGER